MASINISRLWSYYRNSPKFDNDMDRALKDFFSDTSYSEELDPFFNEWLVFDFKLSNGLTPLEDYYLNNPHKIPMYELQVYKNIQDNAYGLLEVLRVDTGKGMLLRNLNTKKEYYVEEYQATFSFKKADLFFSRIARVNGGFKLMGANSFKLRSKSEFGSLEPSLKTTISILSKELGLEKFDLNYSLKKMDSLLEELGLSKMINSSLVYKWIKDFDFKNDFNSIAVVNIISSLMNHSDINLSLSNELISLISDISNNTPNKKLGGKSPAEKVKEMGENYVPSIRSDIRKVNDWEEYLKRATLSMEKNSMEKSLDYFYEVFEVLLEKEAAPFYIYRILTNKAVCHQALGELYLAEKTNDLALKLNKNYDFAIDVKKRIKKSLKHRLSSSDIAKRLRKDLPNDPYPLFQDIVKVMPKLSDKELLKRYNEVLRDYEKDAWLDDPSREYFNFLKKLGINFASDELTDSVRFDIKL